MFNNIYKNKTVLITGHTGFKGSWLTIWLKELGADIVVYSLNPPSEPNNFEAGSAGSASRRWIPKGGD